MSSTETISHLMLGFYERSTKEGDSVIWQKCYMDMYVRISQTKMDQLMKLSIYFEEPRCPVATVNQRKKFQKVVPQSQLPRTGTSIGEDSWISSLQKAIGLIRSGWRYLCKVPGPVARPALLCGGKKSILRGKWDGSNNAMHDAANPPLFFSFLFFGWGQVKRAWKLLNHFGWLTKLYSCLKEKEVVHGKS